MEEHFEVKLRIARRPGGHGTPAASSSASKSGELEAPASLSAIARGLIAEELLTDTTVDTTGRAAFRVCEKLRQPLSIFIGMAGFRSLFSRALTLATGEVPWLGGLQVGPDGAFGFSTEMNAQLDGEEAARGGTALIAQLLGLLVIFIGEALTLRLVHNVWPKATAAAGTPRVVSAASASLSRNAAKAEGGWLLEFGWDPVPSVTMTTSAPAMSA